MSEELAPSESAVSATDANPDGWTKPTFRAVRGENAYTVRVFMPGVAKEGVSVSVDKDVVTIEGTRSDRLEDDWKPVHIELRNADYQLQLQLAADADGKRTKAAVENGVLTLTVPVAESAMPRTIAVK